jgi:hypothetical protein
MEQRVVVGTWPKIAYRLSRLLAPLPPGAEVAVAWGDAPTQRLTATRDHDVASRLARRLAERLPLGTVVTVSWRAPRPVSGRPLSGRRPQQLSPGECRMRTYGVRSLRAINPDPPTRGVSADG